MPMISKMIMDFNVISRKIYSQISGANNILLIIHPNPDADALGSLAALNYWLIDLGKKPTKFCLNQVVGNLAWIVNFEPLATDFEELVKNNYDLVIVLDSGDLKYAGVDKFFSQFSPKPLIINIDHHLTNQYFGDINLVNLSAASTTEIIYQFFKLLKVKISPKIASALLAGIIGDTYNFTNPNTSFQSLETAAHLLVAGARIDRINDSIFKNKTLETLKIWGEILIRLSYNADLGVVSTIVTESDLKENLSPSEVTEGIANFLNNLTGVKASLILQQEAGRIIKGSFRTGDDLIDVSELAKILGGGGHRKAAGFRVKGQLVKTKEGGWQIV